MTLLKDGPGVGLFASTGVEHLRREHYSDLIQHQMGNGLRHPSGPVRLKRPTRYIYISSLILL